MNPTPTSLPPLQVSRWFNTPGPITLASLRGRVVVVHAFQMLCPGCVAHGLPQVATLQQTFAESQVALIGLHTVFEHHDVMGAQALEVFIHEYRLRFAIGIDQVHPDSAVPKTMAAWGLQGTPSLVVLDRQGQLKLKHFGRIEDMALGAVVGQLLAQPETPGVPEMPENAAAGPAKDPPSCTDEICRSD